MQIQQALRHLLEPCNVLQLLGVGEACGEPSLRPGVHAYGGPGLGEGEHVCAHGFGFEHRAQDRNVVRVVHFDGNRAIEVPAPVCSGDIRLPLAPARDSSQVGGAGSCLPP